MLLPVPESTALPAVEAIVQSGSVDDLIYLGALAAALSVEFIVADAEFVEEVHRLWVRVTDDLGIRTGDGKPLPHPLAPMIEGWLRRPVDVEVNRRPDRILPSRLAMVRLGDRRASKLFSPAAHLGIRNGEQQIMPGFESNIEGPALPLALYELGDPNPHRGGGRSAALALRTFVESVLSPYMADRRRYQAVAMELTIRELRARLFPGRRISVKQFMYQFLRAVEALDTMDARIPWHDPTTGKGELRRVVNVTGVPYGVVDLDDVVRVVVDLPPGSETGPIITPALAEWGVRSGPAYRALINLAYRWYQPGRTHFPKGTRRDGNPQWHRKEDPSAYPALTESTMIELAFPTSAHRQRSLLVHRARNVLDVLEQAGELRIVDNRILPPPDPRVN